jgi:hypothetical protein
MIHQLLHKQPVATDRAEHRFVRMKVPVADWSVASKMNSCFVAGSEFGEAARDYPLVFVRAGEDEGGKPAIAPIAVLGMVAEENLFVEGGTWQARYMPALLRFYPFCIGRLDEERFAICFDAGWAGINGTEGERLFTAEGEPTPFLDEVRKNLEVMEQDTQRTRVMCRQLRDMDLLREMRFDANLPAGGKLTVDGFLTVDEQRLNALTDEQVLQLHKTGALGMVHAHYVSLGGMRKLLELHLKRRAAKETPAA